MSSFITFIIPTIGRVSLNRSIYSIINQTKQDFNIIIVFDGKHEFEKIEDNRILYLEAPFTKSPGLTRNYAFEFINSKWIGFLDDDDVIYEKYIEELMKEDEDENLSLVLFRMLSTRITPRLEIKDKIKLNEAGISFALKSNVLKLEKLSFEKSGSEDFIFLNKLVKLGYKFKISDYLAYEVCRDNRDKK